MTHFNDLSAKLLKANAKESKGMPIGIQVVGKPWKEEEVLEVMKAVEKTVNYSR